VTAGSYCRWYTFVLHFKSAWVSSKQLSKQASKQTCDTRRAPGVIWAKPRGPPRAGLYVAMKATLGPLLSIADCVLGGQQSRSGQQQDGSEAQRAGRHHSAHCCAAKRCVKEYTDQSHMTSVCMQR
jgi:hypothetical protein